MVVASASDANAVIPIMVPFAEFSATLLVVALLSTGVVTAASLTSLMAIVKS